MLVIIAALLASAQAPAEPQTTSQPATDAAKPAKPKKICKADPALSGSRMSKRLCLTEEEWAQRSVSMKDSARAGFSGKSEDH